MAKYSNGNLEDLDITKSELKDFGEALKKEEFRTLLNEYVEEVTDPKNRALYEKEVTQLEKERGVDITFIHPKPGYVIKTSVDGLQKAFINICSNETIDKPVSSPRIKDGARGSDWQIPHIITPPKVDLDKKGQRCVVYDVVFNPSTLDIAQRNKEFRSLVNDTALSGVEDSFKAKLDRNNIRLPKMTFKGPKIASIIRKKCPDGSSSEEIPFNIPNYPYKPLKADPIPQVTKPRRTKADDSYTSPNYIIKHRKGIDLQDFSNDPDAKMNSALPSELIVEVDLPLLSSAGDAVLDVTSRSLSLTSEKPSKYKLEINLPYSVDESTGSAKFDKKSKKLIINLPVLKKKLDPSFLSRDDSGIESDLCQNRSSSDEDLRCSDAYISNSQPSPETNLGDDNLRTSDKISEFLSDKVHYVFPPFKVDNYKNFIIMTVSVKNVDPTTVDHKYFSSESGVQFKFSSLGAGHFPIHYAISVQFPDFIIVTSALKFEVWDNNVVINFELSSNCNKTIQSCLIGPNIDGLKLADLGGTLDPAQMVEKTEVYEGVEKVSETVDDESADQPGKLSSPTQQVDPHAEGEPSSDLPNPDQPPSHHSPQSDHSSHHSPAKPASLRGQKKSPKARTLSESTISANLTGGSGGRRSILKTSRSLSESQTDDSNNPWSSLDSTDDPHSPSSLVSKKTVRFSEVISRKIFRANSSILGQRHKNEKKSRNRKKSAERRRLSSESEATSAPSESEVSDFSDYSEVSDLSDCSSDDVAPQSQAQLPSSKSHHRRRASKNSRKNANTFKKNSFILSQD